MTAPAKPATTNTRLITALILSLLIVLNATVFDIHVRFATCPVPLSDDRDATRLFVVVFGFGRVGAPACTTDGVEREVV